jgi:tRNA dimethylallyltransferase
MDFLEPEDEYLVTQFVKDAVIKVKQIYAIAWIYTVTSPFIHEYIKVEDISERKAMPVLVGGTNYYVQSLLWPMSLISSATESDSSSDEQEEADKLTSMDTPSLYKELQRIDPVMAAKWHASDRRKIAKSLKVF